MEVKEPVLQDQLHPAFFPRLRELGVHGRAVRSISTGALAGLSSPSVRLMLVNTSVSGVPTKMLLPVPLSTAVALDVSGSRLTSVSPQLLTRLDDRQRSLSLSQDCRVTPYSATVTPPRSAAGSSRNSRTAGSPTTSRISGNCPK